MPTNDWTAIDATAEGFWELVNVIPHYPCDLEDILLWSQPPDFRLECHHIKELSVSLVNAWAHRVGVSHRFPGPNRRLRGCLLADRGSGSILLDATDPKDERKFTLAHELAHFLVDYYLPRKRALQILGESIRPVLDGIRRPTLTERTHAVLTNVHLGVLGRLMERPEQGLPSANVLMVEDRADRLALAIIAPMARIREQFLQPARPPGRKAQLARITNILQADYELPAEIAAPYARELLRHWGGVSVRDWLLGRD